MSKTLESIKALVAKGDIRISEHGYDELAEDRIPVRAILDGVNEAVVVEDYPDFPKGPTVLVLQFDAQNPPFTLYGGYPKVTPARQSL